MERIVSGTIVDAKTAEEQTLAAQLEIEEISGSSHNFQYQTMTVERDGKIIEIEVPIDNIDLINDYDDDDMSEEGLRSVGVLPEDYDSTSYMDPSTLLKNRNRMLEGKVELVKKLFNNSTEEIEDYLITCPYTGSSNVYQISSNIFASYDTDQPFRVNFNLADLKPDQS